MTSRRGTLQIIGAAAGAMLAPASWAAAPEPLKDIAARKDMRFGNAMGMLNDDGKAALLQQRLPRTDEPAAGLEGIQTCGRTGAASHAV